MHNMLNFHVRSPFKSEFINKFLNYRDVHGLAHGRFQTINLFAKTHPLENANILIQLHVN